MLFKHSPTETASTHITFTLLSILIMKFNLTSKQFIRACLYFCILSNPNDGAMKAHPVDLEKQRNETKLPADHQLEIEISARGFKEFFMELDWYGCEF